MLFSKTTPFLGFLAFGTVLGSKCNLKSSSPDGLVCGDKGFPGNDDGAFEYTFTADTVEECADLCYKNIPSACQAFLFNNGQCQLFANTMQKLSFSKEHGDVSNYDMGCFDCINNDRLVFMDDFTDSDMDDWTLYREGDDFFADVQRKPLYNGRYVNAIRILEATTSGTAELQSKAFPLTAGVKYRFSFYAMVDPRGVIWQQDDFTGIQLAIRDGETTVFQYQPGAGLPLGANWYSWEWDFEIALNQDGDYWISVFIDASGNEMDWYLAMVSVEAINS